MTLFPLEDVADIIHSDLNGSYTLQTIKNNILREAYKICTSIDETKQMEKVKNDLLENLRESSCCLSKEEKDKQKRDIFESFNNLHLRYYAPIHMSVHYKGYLWKAGREFVSGNCLQWDGPLNIRTEDILRFVGREDIVTHLSYFTDITHEEFYTILKGHLVLSDIGLTLDVDGHHDECARNKIISEKVKTLKQTLGYFNDDISFNEYLFERIHENLLRQHQSTSPASDKHITKNVTAQVDRLKAEGTTAGPKAHYSNLQSSSFGVSPTRLSALAKRPSTYPPEWLPKNNINDSDNIEAPQHQTPDSLLSNTNIVNISIQVSSEAHADSTREVNTSNDSNDYQSTKGADQNSTTHPAKRDGGNSEVPQQSSSHTAEKKSVNDKIWKTWLKYMIAMTVLYTKAKKIKNLSTKSNLKEYALDYARLVSDMKELALGVLPDNNANETSHKDNVSNPNIQIFLDEALHSHPTRLEAVGDNLVPPRLKAVGNEIVKSEDRGSCQRYMLLMTILVANTNRQTFLHPKSNSKGPIFNYSRLAESLEDTAVTLWGTGVKTKESVYRLSSSTIETIIKKVLKKYPLKVDVRR
jgi:hypothetical protein